MPRINSAGLQLIKEFEGCELTSYADATGIPTIGYGHTGPEVRLGQTITQARAEQLLQEDVGAAEREVNTVVSHDCTPNQFAALVSFEYNTGSLADSTLLKLFNSGDIQGAADAFRRWVYAGKQILPGLVRRREAERTLFLTPQKGKT